MNNPTAAGRRGAAADVLARVRRAGVRGQGHQLPRLYPRLPQRLLSLARADRGGHHPRGAGAHPDGQAAHRCVRGGFGGSLLVGRDSGFPVSHVLTYTPTVILSRDRHRRRGGEAGPAHAASDGGLAGQAGRGGGADGHGAYIKGVLVDQHVCLHGCMVRPLLPPRPPSPPKS